MTPSFLGPYELGPGSSQGRGVSVWSAVDGRRGRPARVLLGDNDALDSATADRFLERARSFGSIDVHSLIRVQETGVSPEGAPYAVTDAADRGTVARRIGVGSGATDDDLRRIAAAASTGLAAVHERNLIYQTLGPESLLLSAGPAATGVGSGVLFEDDVVRLDVPAPLPQDYKGDRLAAPEQLAGDAATTRTDVYRLSGVVAEVAAGRKLGSKEEWSSLLREVGGERPLLAKALSLGLSAKSSERPASLALWAEEVNGALGSAAGVASGASGSAGGSAGGSKVLWAAAAALVLIVAVAGLSLLGRADDDPETAVATAEPELTATPAPDDPGSAGATAAPSPAPTEAPEPTEVKPTAVPAPTEAEPEPTGAPSAGDDGTEATSDEDDDTSAALGDDGPPEDSDDDDESAESDGQAPSASESGSDDSVDGPGSDDTGSNGTGSNDTGSNDTGSNAGDAADTESGGSGSSGSTGGATTAETHPPAGASPGQSTLPTAVEPVHVAGVTLSPATGVPVWDGISYCPPGGTDPAPGLVVADATNRSIVITYDALGEFLNLFVDGTFHDTLIAGSSRYVIEGLSAQTTYSITVAREADRANGSMICGRTLSFAPSPGPPGALMPSDLRIIEVTPTSVTIQWWAESPDAMHSLHLNGQKVSEVPAGWRQYTFDGLIPGSTNRIGIRAVLDNNRSDLVAFDITTPFQ